MEEAGQRLKRARERLSLKYRDVEVYSQKIADRYRNSEYGISISRLSDFENRGALPNIYKLYSLCAIYRLEMSEVMRWFGVDPSLMPSDAAGIMSERTHLVGFGREGMSRVMSGEIQVPLSLDPGLDLQRTTFLSRFIQSWGVLPLMLVSAYEPKSYQYALIGAEDWFMFPVLQPGSLVLIDDTQKKVAEEGWTTEYDRPIYLLEHREGWLCAWCDVREDRLIALPHPSGLESPLVFSNAGEVEVVGQVVGVANRFRPLTRPRTRSAVG